MTRIARLTQKITAELAPDTLQITDESHLHQRAGSESHIRIIAVSAQFNGLPLVQRHQLVYGWFADELQNGLHALSLHLYSPDEWDKRQKAPETPACAGQKSS